VKGSEVCFYKNSYKDITWEKAQMKKAGNRCSGAKDIDDIKTKLAYNLKIPVAENKKKDIQSFVIKRNSWVFWFLVLLTIYFKFFVEHTLIGFTNTLITLFNDVY